MREVLVIGAGASGLMAALAAAREGAKVTVLDKNKKAGRKLLLTGSGRCNLTNTDPGLFERFHSASPESLKHIAGGFRKLEDSNQTVRFFESLGLACTVRDGYVYPASMMASSVLHVLEDACRRSGVRFRFSEKILSVRTDEDRRWHASTASWTYSADSLILCCGSPAWPLSGADTAGYGLCKMTGHRVTPLLPSLTGLYCSGTGLKEAKGARTDAVVTLLSSADGKGERTVQQTETGQVQWTGDGISGIVVFQISSAAARLLQDGRRKLYVSTDLCPDYTAKELTALIENAAAISCGPDPVKILGGLIHERLACAVLDAYRRLGGEGLQAHLLAHAAKDLTFRVDGTFGFDHAQVCAGGVSLDEVESGTLMSKLHEGLYFAGEMLDADGPCGGYNLQWAWSTGYAAGMAAGRRS